MTGMTRIAAIAAAAAIAGTSTAAALELNLTKSYTRVSIPVWSETVNEKAVATTWCKAKGHGHAVDIVYVGLRKIGNQQGGGNAYYHRIACLMVPLQT